MGATSRQHRYQVPMATRSTDASMINQCAGRWVLSLVHEKDQADASFFILGDLLHRGIEAAIERDLDQAFMCATWLPVEIGKALGAVAEAGKRRIETSKRGFDTLFDDAQRMMVRWFTYVHPDSDKRHPIYDDYAWPPKVERKFERPARSAGTAYPVWGSIDAHFEPLDGGPHGAIVDWKSGTQKIGKDFQLQFYRFGSGRVDDNAWFHHLDRVKRPAMIEEAGEYPGDREMTRLITDVEGFKLRLLEGETPDFKPDWYCNYCPVQEFCPEEGEKTWQDTERVVELLRPLSKVL